MSAPFVAEIRVFAFGNFVPVGWAWCNGQLMPISQNTALFSLLGTTYGGDGKSTFALPDLQGMTPVHPDGQGGHFDSLGQTGGTEVVTLIQSEMPVHSHTMNAADVVGDNPVPTAHTLARYPGAYNASNAGLQQMAPQALPPAGGDAPHNNMMPYLTLSFAIALQGVFPARN
jgi:microcystin-dependent protein